MIIKVVRWIFLLVFVAFAGFTVFSSTAKSDRTLKLYWFIPDGTRNDPNVFDVYKWAEEGYLPNIKKMMDNGSYGYSVPDFPSHTPSNFATLLTGSHPNTHGIADGSMHLEGYPLNIVSLGGFRSTAKKIPPAWMIFEQNKLRTFLLSIPGSTPPELSLGETVTGRWGGWGADFYALNFQDNQDPLFDLTSKSNRLFSYGAKLTEFLSSEVTSDIPKQIKSFSPVKHMIMKAWEKNVDGYIYDSTDDNIVNYDTVAFSLDKKTIISELKQGSWSDWLPITLLWRTRDDYNIYTPQKSEFEKEYATVNIPTSVKIRVIKLSDSGVFSIRFVFNVLNSTNTSPNTVAADLIKNVGPMVDYPDNYPAQLVHHDEDKQTFLDEAHMALNWHKQVVPYIIQKYSPQVVIQDTYTPNQMLVSRWWMGYLDPKSERYNDITEDERATLWKETRDMYKKLDDIIGEILTNKDENTIIVFSSDHGIATLNKEVYLNNLFAKEGLLKIKYDKENNIYDVDFDQSQVIYLQNTNIYINPKGLGGNWKRASGTEYEALRNRVISILENLKDDNGVAPLAKIVKWENVTKEFNLPTNTAGDLVIANTIGYNWVEGVTSDGIIMKTPLITGYKQGILAKQESDLWTSFMIMGPGIKKGYKLTNPVGNADQLPTILKLLNIPIPDYMQGQVIQDILNK